MHHHRKGTRFNIGVDARDGLLRAGAPGYQLTWMDAKVDDWVVTPRRGKPVEIQALWYNALRLMIQWGSQLGAKTDLWLQMAEQAEASFHRRYWFGSGGYLYDVVDGERGDDPSLRPNQIFSLSLSFPILRPERWRPVVDIVSERLLTPVRAAHPGAGSSRLQTDLFWRSSRPRRRLSSGDRMAVADRSLYRCPAAGLPGQGGNPETLGGIQRPSARRRHRYDQRNF